MSFVAIDGRGRRDDAPPAAVLPKNPPPPFGNWAMRRMMVIPPAAMSVISARWSPERRSAGSPINVPMTPVTTPAMRISAGNGRSVA